MRDYRAKKKPAATEPQSEPQPVEEATAEEPTAEEPKGGAKAKTADVRRALAGTAELLCDGLQALALDDDAPHLGAERADEIAGMWADILGPKIEASQLENLPEILAGLGTAGVLMSWRGEYRQYTKSNPKPKGARKPDATPAPSEAKHGRVYDAPEPLQVVKR